MTLFAAVLLLSLVPLNGLVLWAFLNFKPRQRGATVFNFATFLIVPVLCALFSVWVNLRLNGKIEPDWLPFLSALAWPAAFPALLLLAGLIRNFVLFPGGQYSSGTR